MGDSEAIFSIAACLDEFYRRANDEQRQPLAGAQQEVEEPAPLHVVRVTLVPLGDQDEAVEITISCPGRSTAAMDIAEWDVERKGPLPPSLRPIRLALLCSLRRFPRSTIKSTLMRPQEGVVLFAEHSLLASADAAEGLSISSQGQCAAQSFNFPSRFPSCAMKFVMRASADSLQRCWTALQYHIRSMTLLARSSVRIILEGPLGQISAAPPAHDNSKLADPFFSSAASAVLRSLACLGNGFSASTAKTAVVTERVELADETIVCVEAAILLRSGDPPNSIPLPNLPLFLHSRLESFPLPPPRPNDDDDLEFLWRSAAEAVRWNVVLRATLVGPSKRTLGGSCLHLQPMEDCAILTGVEQVHIVCNAVMHRGGDILTLLSRERDRDLPVAIGDAMTACLEKCARDLCQMQKDAGPSQLPGRVLLNVSSQARSIASIVSRSENVEFQEAVLKALDLPEHALVPERLSKCIREKLSALLLQQYRDSLSSRQARRPS
jgi:hypothetical protein